MIRSAALLMRERGVEATSFSEVVAHSGAPRGSIYHHFPGGKAELVEAATRWAGEQIEAGEIAALAGDDPVGGIDAMAAVWRTVLRESDFAAGCPVVAATVDGGTPAALDAADAAFRSWVAPYSEALQQSGIASERAVALATLVVASFEGAIILARAQRSLEPLDRVVIELRATIADAVSRPSARAGSASGQ